MHPAPIKVSRDQLARTAPTATYVQTLASGERIYTDGARIYAVQPATFDTGQVHGPTRDDLPREEYARLEALKMGREAGIAAGSWAADGNSSSEHLARMVEMFEAGDPEVYNYLPEGPNLSGEWADDPTPSSILREILGDLDDLDPQDFDDLREIVCNAWEDGVSETFEQECERTIRAFLPDPEEDTSEDRCTEHGFDECPDCGNAGVKIGAQGYESCTRFLTCWADPTDA